MQEHIKKELLKKFIREELNPKDVGFLVYTDLDEVNQMGARNIKEKFKAFAEKEEPTKIVTLNS